MRTTLITLGLVLLIGSGFFAFLYFTASTDTEKWFATTEAPPTSSYTEMVMSAQEIEKNDVAYANAAVREQDITICEQITSTEKKVNCQDMIHASIAQSTDNIESCRALSQTGMVVLCEDNIYVARAQTKGDKKQCDAVRSTSLKSYCDEQVDTERLKIALENNTLSQSFCRSLVDDIQSECERSLVRTDNTMIYAIAVEERDPKKCDTLTDDTFRVNCHDAVVLQLAFAEKNTDYCESISDATKKAYCQNTLYKQSDAARFQDIVAGGDIAGCNSLSDKKLQYQCSDMITLAQVRQTRDEALCANLFNTGMQFACAQIANAQ